MNNNEEFRNGGDKSFPINHLILMHHSPPLGSIPLSKGLLLLLLLRVLGTPHVGSIPLVGRLVVPLLSRRFLGYKLVTLRDIANCFLRREIKSQSPGKTDVS